ncbi:MAG: hypothetical protein COU68_04245 [Candidatus Pacebacteria bacterium CG10_big_fil_rev_8_21_14_0_10_45_6]|nr:MAG: hypothetical protein COU68_04245 [Candidatus Pacebacteria bacterium CG10_big_fil_rev_8_21_14_0_10_45_6]
MTSVPVPPSAAEMARTAAPQASPPTQQSRPTESEFFPGMNKPMPEEVIFEWIAPERPFKKHNRQFFTTIWMIALLLSLIFFFAGQLPLIAVVLAVVFMIYMLFTIPPGIVSHKITTYGFRVEGKLYYWEEMGRFWLTKKYGQDLLHIEVGRFPFQLTTLLSEELPENTMRLILSEILLEETPEPTAYEKMASWLHKKIPIDIES